jgi:hypothetical protein
MENETIRAQVEAQALFCHFERLEHWLVSPSASRARKEL